MVWPAIPPPHRYLTILFNPSHVQAVSFGSLCCCISPHKPIIMPLDLRAPTALSAQVERYLHVGLEVFTAHLLIHRSAILILKSSPRLRVAGTQRLICMGQPAGRFPVDLVGLGKSNRSLLAMMLSMLTGQPSSSPPRCDGSFRDPWFYFENTRNTFSAEKMETVMVSSVGTLAG